MANIPGIRQDSSVFYKPGTYYLEIKDDSVDYSIAVEELVKDKTAVQPSKAK